MIEIIKSGTLPKEFYFGECTNCRTSVKCEKTDHDASWDASRRKNAIIEVSCPLEGCNGKIRCRKLPKKKVLL